MRKQIFLTLQSLFKARLQWVKSVDYYTQQPFKSDVNQFIAPAIFICFESATPYYESNERIRYEGVLSIYVYSENYQKDYLDILDRVQPVQDLLFTTTYEEFTLTPSSETYEQVADNYRLDKLEFEIIWYHTPKNNYIWVNGTDGYGNRPPTYPTAVFVEFDIETTII